jgi:ribonuclease HI
MLKSKVFILPVQRKRILTNTHEGKIHIYDQIQYKDLFDIVYFDNFFSFHPSQFIASDIRVELYKEINTSSIDIIKKFLDPSIDRNKLYSLQQKLQGLPNNNFIIYTDGSVKNIALIDASMTFGTTIYDSDMDLLVEFTSSINYWLSSTKAESMAVLISLLILPKNSSVNLFTDSSAVVNNFNTFKAHNFSLTTRQLFKIPNNIYIWNIIMEVIKILALDVSIFKVTAHADDIYNNYVDKIVSEAHDVIDIKNLNLKYSHFLSLQWIPVWRNIPIEQNLRKFLTLMTNIKGLEQFLNLNRNAKYRTLFIDWKSTFNNLQGNQGNLFTDFKESKIKRKKVQFLIQELPCIEQVKKSLYSLYKDWKCPICQQCEENFNHIWLCNDKAIQMISVVNFCKKTLIDQINDHIENNNSKVTYHDINALNDIWTLVESDNKLTFLDQIKGFVPLLLKDFINDRIKNLKITKDILYNYRQITFDYLYREIWLQRCNKFKEEEQHNNITKQMKIENRNKERYEITRHPSTVPKYSNLEGLLMHIYFGGNVLGFMIIAYHVSLVLYIRMRI